MKKIAIITITFLTLYSNLFAQITIDKKFSQKHYSKGLSLVNQKDMNAAITEFKKSIKADSTLYIAYIDIAICYKKIKNNPSAIKYFEKSLKNNPRELISLNGLAEIYKEQIEYQKALDYYLKIVEFYKNDFEGYEGAAAMMLRLEVDYEKAIDFLCQSYIIQKEKRISNSTKYTFSEAIRISEFKLEKNKIKKEIFDKTLKKYNLNLN